MENQPSNDESLDKPTVEFDWNFSTSKPVKVQEKLDQVDWSSSLFDSNSFAKRFQNDDLELELDLKISDSEDEEEINKKIETKEEKPKIEVSNQMISSDPEIKDSTNLKITDIFAQQIKFISCLKILIEEMSNLATGFEVYGGQLRYYMYYWLERETKFLREFGDHVCLKDIIDSNNVESETSIDDSPLLSITESIKNGNYNNMSNESSSSLLHEQVINDQNIFQEKIRRFNKRKIWLRSNELLLRTFLSYCSLHSASTQGLASVKMELVLLMQELVEDRSTAMRQLCETVPLQTTTTIPLLAASIASSKNILAGPIQMLKRLSFDVLSSVASIVRVPNIFDYPILISTLKEVSVSLSSCIYQCLCDYDSEICDESPETLDQNSSSSIVEFNPTELSRNILYKTTYLMKKDELKKNLRNRPINLDNNPYKINSQPRNWPGLAHLNKILERSIEDQEVPKLKVLLYESLVAVYSSLLLNAFVFYDCSNLYRLISKEWNETMWNKLFGGACQLEYKYKYSAKPLSLGKN